MVAEEGNIICLPGYASSIQEVTHAPVHGPTPMNIPAPLSEFRKRTGEVGRKREACGMGKGEGVGFTKTHYMNVLIFH